MHTSYPGPADVVRTLVRRPLRWLVPALAIAGLAAGMAMVRKDKFEASQALVIRNDAAANTEGPGKFRQLDDMKAVLETVMELSKSQAVLSAALAEVGSPSGPAQVAALAPNVKLTPPKGAEFGKTEVFYLKVTDRDPQRAAALATAVCRQLQARYGRLRDTRATSMLDELTEAERLAQVDLSASLARLGKLEGSVGSDLAELRSLEQNSGDSDLRRKALELETELRHAELEERNQAELLKTLIAARGDDKALLAAPHGLLESQPALRRLKDGLADAQLRTATLLGSMSRKHPQVIAALAVEDEVRQHLRQEIEMSVRGVEVDFRLAHERVQHLRTEIASAHERLSRLAGLRAEYSSVSSDVGLRTRLVEEIQRKLSDARADKAASEVASLLTAVDEPNVSTGPIGPSRLVIIAAGIAGGLAAGIGLVLLTVQPLPPVPAAVEPVAARPTTFEPGVLSLKKALLKTSIHAA